MGFLVIFICFILGLICGAKDGGARAGCIGAMILYVGFLFLFGTLHSLVGGRDGSIYAAMWAIVPSAIGLILGIFIPKSNTKKIILPPDNYNSLPVVQIKQSKEEFIDRFRLNFKRTLQIISDRKGILAQNGVTSDDIYSIKQMFEYFEGEIDNMEYDEANHKLYNKYNNGDSLIGNNPRKDYDGVYHRHYTMYALGARMEFNMSNEDAFCWWRYIGEHEDYGVSVMYGKVIYSK